MRFFSQPLATTKTPVAAAVLDLEVDLHARRDRAVAALQRGLGEAVPLAVRRR